MVKVQLIEDGNVVEERDFEGVVGVGFTSNPSEGLLGRLLGATTAESFALGMLSEEDFIDTVEILSMLIQHNLKELGLDEEEIENLRGRFIFPHEED